MRKQNRVADQVRWLTLMLLGVIALFVYLGPVAPDVRWRAQDGHGSGSVLEDVELEATSPSKTTIFEEVTAANARSSGRLPTFRNARISRGSVGATRTIAAKNGFLILFPSKGGTHVTPAVYGGLLVAGGPSGSRSVHAFEARTGAPVWTVNLEDNGPSAPACADGVCAFTTESCSLYVLDAKTGTPLWGKWLADPILSAPAIAKGLVFATYPTHQGFGTGSAQGSVVAFEAKSGRVVWEKRLDEDMISAPAVRGDVLSLATLTGSRFQFAVSTGAPLGASPGKKVGSKLDGMNGATSFSSPSANGAAYHVLRHVPRPAESRPLFLAGSTVVMRGREVIATGPTGDRLWTASVNATTAPIAAGGSVWVGTAQNTVVRLDRETGKTLRTVEVGSLVTAEPLIEGGWLYAATGDGLVGIDLEDPTLTGWPQWGGDAQRTSVGNAKTVVGSAGSLALAAP